MLPKELQLILRPLYQGAAERCPCNLRFDAQNGWIPRGMFGAEAGGSKVQLVVVSQNPGHPLHGEAETYRQALSCTDDDARADKLLELQEQFIRTVHLQPPTGKNGRYHRELMGLLREALGTDDEGVLRHVYFTEAVKCSTADEQAQIALSLYRECTGRTLGRELALFPEAPILALGRGAENAVREASPVAKRTIYVSHPSRGIRNRSEVLEKLAEVLHFRDRSADTEMRDRVQPGTEGKGWYWCSGEGPSVQIGQVNRNDQRCCGHRGVPGTDHAQFAYKVECLRCGYVYGANGSDMHERRCPMCQDGAPGIQFWRT